jgi:undecaprenyl-phosphate 4-deoxy-4-formamido-L-arabinose transferase
MSARCSDPKGEHPDNPTTYTESVMMTIKKKISVVVPVYKSQECVQALVNRVDECLQGKEYELVLVNDGSPDNSWEEIKKAARSNKRVIGISLRKNSGQDNALMAGFSAVTGDYVVIMDDDLQHNPADIERMAEELERGSYDACYANFGTKKEKLWKRLGSWLNGKMAEIIIRKPRHIYLSPFKILRKEIMDEIIKYVGPYPYIDGLIFTITQNVTQLPVEHHERFAGRGNYTFLRSILVSLKLMTGFSVFPLRVAIIIGFIVSISGFILSLFYFLKFFIAGESVAGWTSLIMVTLILGGMILIALGIVGEYVGRSYVQLNKKPPYSIKEVLNRE